MDMVICGWCQFSVAPLKTFYCQRGADTYLDPMYRLAFNNAVNLLVYCRDKIVDKKSRLWMCLIVTIVNLANKTYFHLENGNWKILPSLTMSEAEKCKKIRFMTITLCCL